MGINDRPGPGESVYRTRAAGDSTGEDDVEGHGAFKLRESGDEEDTEGHGAFKLRESGDEEDTEGHGVRRS